MYEQVIYRSSIRSMVLEDIVFLCLFVIYLPLFAMFFKLGIQHQLFIAASFAIFYYIKLGLSNHDIIISGNRLMIANRLFFNLNKYEVNIDRIEELQFFADVKKSKLPKRKYVLIKEKSGDRLKKIKCYGLKYSSDNSTENDFKQLFYNLKAKQIPAEWKKN